MSYRVAYQRFTRKVYIDNRTTNRMTLTVEFHRLEGYRTASHVQGPKVHVSFKTKQYGILQVEFSKDSGLQELTNEPDLYLFREKDQAYIEEAAAIAWKMVFDTSAAKHRFE